MLDTNHLYVKSILNSSRVHLNVESFQYIPSEFEILSVLPQHLADDAFNINSPHKSTVWVLQLSNIETKDQIATLCLLGTDPTLYFDVVESMRNEVCDV